MKCFLDFEAKEAMVFAVFIGINFNGYMIKIPKTLKAKWQSAIVMPASIPKLNAASTAVIVVPILAPRVYGKTCSIVRTPAATSGISIDVVIELDCTSAVKNVPKAMLMRAFLNRYRFSIRSIFSITMPFIFFIIPAMEKNKHIIAKIRSSQ